MALIVNAEPARKASPGPQARGPNAHGSGPRAHLAQAALLLLSIVAAWLLAGSPLGHLADNNISDALVRHFRSGLAAESRAPLSAGAPVLLAIDEETLGRHGGMRGLRSILAGILERIAPLHPKVVAIDLTLADRGDPAEDARLARAISALPAVVLAAEIRSTGGAWELPAPAFAQAVSSIGHVHAAPDPMDSVCRAIPLEKAVARERFWAFSLEAYRLFRGEPFILETPDSLFIGSVEIPAPRNDGRLLQIRYLPPNDESGSGIPSVSAARLLTGPAPATLPKEAVFFVGVTAPSAARDRLMTPFSYGRSMQGVEIHANAFETLRSRRFYRPLPAALAFLASLALAALIGAAFLFRSNWRAYSFALPPLAASVAVPPAAYLNDILAPSSLLLLSAFLPFFALAAHRYWFVSRRLRQSEREAENYRGAIHYVAHEMRTPLTAIQGSSELISRYDLSAPKQKQIAGLIHSESKRLGRLIQAFLDVERLSAGQMQLRDETFQASDLVSVCVERAGPLAENKEITLVVQGAPPNAAPLRGDRELLEHALYNLVTNAIKYSPAGATVTVRAERREAEAVISVIDQGEGLSPEDQRAVFRKFYRTASAERSGVAGSGIGLSIVEQIAGAHGGRVELQSRLGEGSVFSIVLPQGAGA